VIRAIKFSIWSYSEQHLSSPGALGLGGFVYFYEVQGASQQQIAKKQKQQIFSFENEQSTILYRKTKALSFERSEDNDGKSIWRMKIIL